MGTVVDVDVEGVAFAVFVGFGFAVAFGFGCFEVVVLITSAAEEAEDLAGAKSALQPLNALIPEDAILTVSVESHCQVLKQRK